MTLVDLEVHDSAVLGVLRDALSPRPVGFAEAPEGVLEALRRDPPGPDYLIVYPLDGGTRDGSLSDPFADAELLYQVTIVARLPEAARDMVSKVEAALAGVAVSGRVVLQVIPEGIPGVIRDEALGDPPVFFCTPIWRLSTAPA